MSQPKGLPPILFLELWERFSYVGMRSLLMLYMTQELGFDSARAGTFYGNYMAAGYMLPVLGGLLADRRLGTRRAITIGAVLMGLGHFAMVLSYNWAFYLALTLLVVGTGMFKANTASLVGELYEEHDARRETGFYLFYLTVNIGSFAAPLVCGTLAAQGRWHLGFGAAGLGMLLGLVVWFACLGRLGEHGLAPRRAAKAPNLLAEVQRPHAPVRMPHNRRLTAVERDRLWVVLILACLGNISLWAALGQAGSSLALFADRATNLTVPFLGHALPASWLQAVNPLLILVGMPLVGALWRLLERRGVQVVAVHKFAIGLALVAAGFFLMSRAGFRADAGCKVSMGWLLAATLLNTLGELCVAPVGLSLVTKLSPKRLGAASMGVWYASIGVAFWVGGQLAGFYDALDKGILFAIPCFVTAAMALVLLALARPITRLMHGVQ